MAKKKFHKWVVEFQVAEIWLKDGFDPDKDVFRDALMEYSLGYAEESEVKAKIISKPDKKTLEKLQGY